MWYDKEVWCEVEHDGVACGCLGGVTKRKRRDEFSEGALSAVGKRACPWRIKRLRREIETLYEVCADDVELSSIIKQRTDGSAFVIKRSVLELI